MNGIRRILFFFVTICCWVAAMGFTAAWLCAHIEHADAAGSVRIPMARAEKKESTVFSAQFEMDARMRRCHDHRVRVLVSMPAGPEVRKSLERHSLAISRNGESCALTMGNLHEPYAEMRQYAPHPENCLLAETELDCGRGSNAVSLEITPRLSAEAGLCAVLYFPDAEKRVTLLALKAGGTFFFLLLALVLSLLFFHGERKYPGLLRSLLARAFLMIPAEFLLLLLSVALWKASLSGQAPRVADMFLSGTSGEHPGHAVALLFSGLNLGLLALLFLYLIVLLAVRLVRLLRSQRKKS